MRLLDSLCLAILLVLGPTEGRAEVAQYQTEVSAEELDAWIAFRGNAPFLRGQNAIDGLVLVKSLEAFAEDRELHLRPAVRIALMREEGAAAVTRLRRETSQAIELSGEAIDAELAARPPKDRPRRVRMRNLFRRFPEDDEGRQEVREAMRSYRLAVEEGADFADLAKRHSESETRWRGGLLGNVAAGTLATEVDRIIANLAAGETSDILETEEGLTLLYCERILPPHILSKAEKRQRVENRLWHWTFDSRWAAIGTELKTMAQIRYGKPSPPRAPEGDEGMPERALEIPDEGEGDREGFIFYAGGHLTPPEVATIVGASSPESVEEVPQASRVAAIEAFLRGQMALRYQSEQGWRHDAKTRDHLRWRRRQILASHQLAAWVDNRFEEPDSDAVQAHFSAHRGRFERPEQLQISLIRLLRDEENPRADVRRAVGLLEAIRRGSFDFAAVARDHSSHPSAQHGGRLPPIPRPKLAARLGIDLAQVVGTLAIDEVSELAYTEDALWILRIDGISPRRPATLDESTARVRQNLISERLELLHSAVVEEWLEELEIRFDQ